LVVGIFVASSPNDAFLLLHLLLHDAPSRIVPQHWSGKEKGIDAVEHASVTGKNRS
jgi:hypothetical protein